MKLFTISLLLLLSVCGCKHPDFTTAAWEKVDSATSVLITTKGSDSLYHADIPLQLTLEAMIDSNNKLADKQIVDSFRKEKTDSVLDLILASTLSGKLKLHSEGYIKE